MVEAPPGFTFNMGGGQFVIESSTNVRVDHNDIKQVSKVRLGFYVVVSVSSMVGIMRAVFGAAALNWA